MTCPHWILFSLFVELCSFTWFRMFSCEYLAVFLIMKMAFKMLLLSTLCHIDQNNLIPQDGCLWVELCSSASIDKKTIPLLMFLCEIPSAPTVEGYLSFIITKLMIWPHWSVFQIMQREWFGIVNTLVSSPVILLSSDIKPLQTFYLIFFFFSVSCRVCEHLHKPMSLGSGGSQCSKSWGFSRDVFLCTVGTDLSHWRNGV